MNLAIYLRYSSDNQRDNLSLAMQREACRRFAGQQFDGARCIEFVDEAESGLQHDRPGYQAMLAAARSGQIEAVLVYKYDRLGRSQIDQLLVLEELEERLGVEVWSATEPRDTVVRGILGVIAEFESRKLGQRLRDAGRQAVREGFAFGRAPYGYKIERVLAGRRTRGKFVISKPEASVVRAIFKDSAAGRSYRDIVGDLNGRGVVSPGGGTWDISAVQAILHNEAYLGRMIRSRIERRELRDGTCRNIVRPRSEWVITENAHTAIITVDVWDAVHAALGGRTPAMSGSGRGVVGRRPKYLLSGILTCGECGGPFIAHSGIARGKKYWAYACAHRRSRGRGVCDNSARLPGPWAEHEVLHGLVDGFAEVADEACRIVEIALASADRRGMDLAAELADVERKIARANRVLLECPEELVRGVQSDLLRLGDRRRELRGRMAAGRSGGAAPGELRAEVEQELARVMGDLKAHGDLPATRQALSDVVRSAVVQPDGLVRVEGDLSEALSPLGCFQHGEAEGTCTQDTTRIVFEFRRAG